MTTNLPTPIRLQLFMWLFCLPTLPLPIVYIQIYFLGFVLVINLYIHYVLSSLVLDILGSILYVLGLVEGLLGVCSIVICLVSCSVSLVVHGLGSLILIPGCLLILYLLYSFLFLFYLLIFVLSIFNQFNSFIFSNIIIIYYI